MEEPKKREEIPEEYKWNLEALYKDEESYEADFSKLEGLVCECEAFKGRLHESPETLAQAFAAKYRLYRHLSKLSTYAVRRHDEDLGNSRALARSDKLGSTESLISSRLSWFEPEILAMESAALDAYQRSPALAAYARPLHNILRNKPHTLSPPEERLLALLEDPLECAAKAYRILLNADSHFGAVTVDGSPVQFTRGKYSVLIHSADRKVREDTYRTLYREQEHRINTYAALLDSQVRRDIFHAKVAKFPSALAAALHGDAVDTSVYVSLIEAIHKSLPTSFQRYLSLRKRYLKLDKLSFYDLFVPLVKSVRVDVPFDTAVDWMRGALAPLGPEYVGMIDTALRERWIDRFENVGKRSGAYSSGCYDSHPYILTNYAGELKSAFTLIHEFGHSMHTFLSNRAQPYHLARYRIFVAEIASTVNECLLQDYLLKNLESQLKGGDVDYKEVRAYLLSNSCDSFRGTVFRQVMFAEFEKIVHEHVEKGGALTADALCDMYADLNRLYFGDEVDVDKPISYEWSRIPHFFYNFYVYKYATSFCVAQKVSASIINGEPGAVDRYLKFLSSGCTKDPMDLIRDILGIDLSDPKVVQDSLELFGKTVEDLEKLILN